MRLLDRLLSGGLLYAESIEDGDDWQALLDGLTEAQLVVIDNVADYLSSRLAQSSEKLVTGDFPCVTLPFPNMFFDLRVHQPSLLYPAFEEAGLWTRMIEREVALPLFEGGQGANIFDREDITAILLCFVYLRERGSHGAVETACFSIPIDREGALVSRSGKYIETMSRLSSFEGLKGIDQDSYLSTITHYVVFPALLATSFMHCKNVKVVEETPPTKLSRIHRGKTGKNLLRYRVLQIDRMRTTLEREGKANETGLKMALHICRGHFSAYGESFGRRGRLFGKHEGLFWVPMHTRGSKEKGIVVKDYEVK